MTSRQSIRTLIAGCLMSVAAISATQAWSQTYSLSLLPSDVPNPGIRAIARGISGDGNVIVGSGSALQSPFERPYIWRKADGVWTRRDLFTFGVAGRAIAASHDGSVVVGMISSYAANVVYYGTPAVWRNTEGVISRPETPFVTETPSSVLRGAFTGVSASGTRAFGFARNVNGNVGSSNVYVYDQGSTPTSVATFNQFTGGHPAGHVMSADGTRATHYLGSGSGAGSNTAFLWNESTGSSVLPFNSGSLFARTSTISGDGRLVAGYLVGVSSSDFQSGPPVIWRDGVFSQLASPNNVINALVTGSDTTGRVLVGIAGNSNNLARATSDISFAGNNFAAIWIDGQAFSLATYLTSNGVDLGNLTPLLASSVSADGRTVVGVATRPIGTTTQREYVSFVATIPTPGTLFGMSLWVAFAARRRR